MAPIHLISPLSEGDSLRPKATSHSAGERWKARVKAQRSSLAAHLASPSGMPAQSGSSSALRDQTTLPRKTSSSAENRNSVGLPRSAKD